MSQHPPFNISIWVVLTLVGLGLHSINSEILRPYGRDESELITFFLGVMPNFLAAALIFPFGFLMICERIPNMAHFDNRVVLNKYFWLGLAGSQTCLILWEFMQKNSDNLRYDFYDIGATVMGGLFAAGIYNVVYKRYLEKKAI